MAITQRAKEGAEIRKLIRGLSKGSSRKVSPTVLGMLTPEQPFDGLLLAESRLYRRCRELFLKEGSFRGELRSSPRSLAAPDLVDPTIAYSPIGSEWNWLAALSGARATSLTLSRLEQLRHYVTSIFHEQNHRLFWRLLPPPNPRGTERDFLRYLNFAESLVVTLDMALGDELGPKLARPLYQLGVIYDPGTNVRKEVSSRRGYRNYLHAALVATFWTLELYDPEKIVSEIGRVFPHDPALARRAAIRSTRLDASFVVGTNRSWQKLNAQHAMKALTARRSHQNPLRLSDDPSNIVTHYLIAENAFNRVGL